MLSHYVRLPALSLGLWLISCSEPSYRAELGEGGTTAVRPKRDAGKDASRVAAPPIDVDAPADDVPADDVPADDMPLPGLPNPPDDSCNPEGMHAIQLDYTLARDPNAAPVPIELEGDLGYTRVVGLAKITRDESGGWRGSARPCWGEVPDFQALGLRFGAKIADATWDRIDRSWDVVLRAPCTRPDCMISSSFLFAQLGLDLAETSNWPARSDVIDPARMTDDDGDGVPGVRASVKGPSDPGGYSYLPLPSFEQIDELSVALRIGADLFGFIQTCDVFSGNARKPTLALAILACRIAKDGRPCRTDEIKFVNDNIPAWRVTLASWQSQRLPDDATCADVRARLTD
jgi:hypothetical protein